MIGAAYFTSSKPKVPKFKTVDFGAETAAAIAENQRNLPALGQLAGDINALSSSQIEAAMERSLPGYRNLVNKGTQQVTSFLKGEVPADVQRFLERKIAEKGIGTGVAGSAFNLTDLAGTYGKTSLDLVQQGLDSATKWLASAQSRTPTFDFTQMFVPIGQRVGVRAAENQFQWQRDWLRNKIHSIPWGFSGWITDFANAATEDIHTWGQMMAGYGVSSIGSGGGGAGGGGGGGGTGGGMMGVGRG